MGSRWRQGVTPEQHKAHLRWIIARDTGWSLEYIDQLPIGVLWEYQSVRDAERKINEAATNKPRGRRGRRGRRR